MIEKLSKWTLEKEAKRQMCNIQYYMGNVFSYTGLTVFICIKGVKSQKMTMVSRTVTDESLVIVLLFCTLFPVVRMIDRS